MKDKKKIVVIIISVVLFIILILGVTYAFFNYNRSVADRFSTSSVDFEYTDDTLLNVSFDIPQDTDLTNEELVAMKSNHSGSLSVSGHNTLTEGVKYSIYVIRGDDISGKQRLADSSIKFQLEPYQLI